jgi:hypothetical protein
VCFGAWRFYGRFGGGLGENNNVELQFTPVQAKYVFPFLIWLLQDVKVFVKCGGWWWGV